MIDICNNHLHFPNHIQNFKIFLHYILLAIFISYHYDIFRSFLFYNKSTFWTNPLYINDMYGTIQN